MITIRELTPDDAEQFRELRRMALQLSEDGFVNALEDWDNKPMPEVRQMLREELDSTNDFILGAFEDETLIGMIGFFRPSKPMLGQKGHIWGAFLLPEWRSQGVGGKLLDELIRRAERIPGLHQLQLTCINRNKNVISLYRSRGFRIFATEQSAVRIGNYYYDELYMNLELR